jgi:hypothetical protein
MIVLNDDIYFQVHLSFEYVTYKRKIQEFIVK